MSIQRSRGKPGTAVYVSFKVSANQQRHIDVTPIDEKRDIDRKPFPARKTDPPWTLVIDRGRGTHSRQFRAKSLSTAIEWPSEEDPSENCLTPLALKSVQIDGMSNLWCGSGMNDRDALVLAHIVLTTERG